MKLKRQNEIVLKISKANQPAGEEKKKEHGSYVFRFQTPRFNYNWFWHFFKEKNLLCFLGGFEDMFLLFVITIFFPTIAMIYGLHLTPPCKSQSHPTSSHKEHMASRCLHCQHHHRLDLILYHHHRNGSKMCHKGQTNLHECRFGQITFINKQI